MNNSIKKIGGLGINHFNLKKEPLPSSQVGKGSIVFMRFAQSGKTIYYFPKLILFTPQNFIIRTFNKKGLRKKSKWHEIMKNTDKKCRKKKNMVGYYWNRPQIAPKKMVQLTMAQVFESDIDLSVDIHMVETITLILRPN